MNASPESVGFSAERLGRITAYLQGKIDSGEMPGMIATLFRRGQTAYYEKLGYLDREARTPMRDDAIFMIASTTKPVTAVATPAKHMATTTKKIPRRKALTSLGGHFF